MRCDKESLLLYAVTDRSWTKNDTLYHQVEEALKGGVTFLQLREKDLNTENFLQEAEEKVVCRIQSSVCDQRQCRNRPYSGS